MISVDPGNNAGVPPIRKQQAADAIAPMVPGAPEKVTLGYILLQKFVSFWVHRFFRDVEIHYVCPAQQGPVLFAANHPNNLIDTILVGYAIKRKVHFLATAQLFKNKILSLFLHNVGIIPVYRKQDDPSHSEKNIATFQECFQVLKNGGAIGIYPEGITHTEMRVKQIKTGAARIALEAEDDFHPGIKLVPIGLNYSIRKSFRSEVIWIQTMHWLTPDFPIAMPFSHATMCFLQESPFPPQKKRQWSR